MKVHTVKVSFHGKRGLPNYSHRESEVILEGELDAGENHEDVMAALLDQAERAVSRILLRPSEVQLLDQYIAAYGVLDLPERDVNAG